MDEQNASHRKSVPVHTRVAADGPELRLRERLAQAGTWVSREGVTLRDRSQGPKATSRSHEAPGRRKSAATGRKRKGARVRGEKARVSANGYRVLLGVTKMF